MKKRVILFFFALILLSQLVYSSTPPLNSKINSVKLFQNKGEIIRHVNVVLEKGRNRIVIGYLPPSLYDWSLKAGVENLKNSRILSVEVEKFALTTRRRIEIENIEKKLTELQEEDRIFLDSLKNIKSQLTFLDSLSSFSADTAKNDILKGSPKSATWNETLNFIAKKRLTLYKQRRAVEKKREFLGKRIRKWEYELSKLGGIRYFNNYQALNQTISTNRGALKVQEFGDITDKYEKRNLLLDTPQSETDYEKRAVVEIYSPNKTKATLVVKYILPGTRWAMEYDLRADMNNKSIELSLYANLYQQTGENWNNVSVAISTGAPSNSISIPRFNPWYIDVIRRDRGYATGAMDAEASVEKSFAKKSRLETVKEDGTAPPSPTIRQSGTYMTIDLPTRQNINSQEKYQKKFIKTYQLQLAGDGDFFYETFPAHSQQTYLKGKVKNSTSLPWLQGSGQIFLDNEFMGKVTLPYTPSGEEQEFVLGTIPEISSEKKLVKRYEKKGGVFGGNRTIEYHYTITIHNRTKTRKKITLLDSFPVSRNKEISIELNKLSVPFQEVTTDEEKIFFKQGLRTWQFNIEAHSKKEVSYILQIVFDKDLSISGI